MAVPSTRGSSSENNVGDGKNPCVGEWWLCLLRIHCAEALGTPIVGDYKYGWYAHRRWRQMNRADYEPVTGESYKLRRPEGLAVQKGSVLSKVPLLHLHFRELVLPNVAKFLQVSDLQQHILDSPKNSSKLDLLRFVAPMPSHMKISWNLMSSYLLEIASQDVTLIQEFGKLNLVDNVLVEEQNRCIM
ncbi:hypothetical protein ACLOJK_029196 [Asimina triloba]